MLAFFFFFKQNCLNSVKCLRAKEQMKSMDVGLISLKQKGLLISSDCKEL